MGGETLYNPRAWRTFCFISLVIVLLVTNVPATRATNPIEPTTSVHMDVSPGLANAKTYDLQTISIHDYTIVFQPSNATGNATKGNTTANGTTTLIPSPGPVLITFYAGTGAQIQGEGGRYNLSDGSFFLSFSITPDFGFDTIRVSVLDFALNRTATTSFTSAFSDSYRYYLFQKEMNNVSSWAYNFITSNEAQRTTESEIGLGVTIALLLLVAGLALHKNARKLGILSWWDRVKLATHLSVYTDPMQNALDPKGYNQDGVGEQRLLALRNDRKGLDRYLVTLLREAVIVEGMLDLDDAETKEVRETIRRLREHRQLPAEPIERDVVQIGGIEGKSFPEAALVRDVAVDPGEEPSSDETTKPPRKKKEAST